MNKTNKECTCKDYSEYYQQLDAAQSLAYFNGWRYTGKVFVFCPWCGKRLENIKRKRIIKKEINYSSEHPTQIAETSTSIKL